MRRNTIVLLLAILSALLPHVSFGQAKSYHLGETIELGKALKMRAIRTDANVFANVKLTGTPKVFELQFERNGGPIIALEASTDSANTAVLLTIGETRFAPKALGTKKGAELEAVMVESLEVSKETGRADSGSVSVVNRREFSGCSTCQRK